MKPYPAQGFGLIKFLHKKNTFLHIVRYLLCVIITKGNRIILLNFKPFDANVFLRLDVKRRIL